MHFGIVSGTTGTVGEHCTLLFHSEQPLLLRGIPTLTCRSQLSPLFPPGHPPPATGHHTFSTLAAAIHSQKRVLDMPDDLRISVDDIKKRKQAGEDFVFIDTRNPQAWAESDVTLPNAIRVPVDDFEEYLNEIPKNKSLVTYCT